MLQIGNKKINVNKFAAGGEVKDLQAHASGVRTFEIRELVTLTAAQTVDISHKIPANSQITLISLKSSTGLSLATATHLSVGTAADPDAYLETALATLDAKNKAVITRFATPEVIAAETTVALATTNGSGADAGTGTWVGSVHIIYNTYDGLQDFE
ncbi:MAG: hypothetical protein JKY67_00080 [Pseudomonadales bacterium]|nr:hypothetical protein [Pseudomonadales bacterium]